MEPRSQKVHSPLKLPALGKPKAGKEKPGRDEYVTVWQKKGDRAHNTETVLGKKPPRERPGYFHACATMKTVNLETCRSKWILPNPHIKYVPLYSKAPRNSKKRRRYFEYLLSLEPKFLEEFQDNKIHKMRPFQILDRNITENTPKTQNEINSLLQKKVKSLIFSKSNEEPMPPIKVVKKKVKIHFTRKPDQEESNTYNSIMHQDSLSIKSDISSPPVFSPLPSLPNIVNSLSNQSKLPSLSISLNSMNLPLKKIEEEADISAIHEDIEEPIVLDAKIRASSKEATPKDIESLPGRATSQRASSLKPDPSKLPPIVENTNNTNFDKLSMETRGRKGRREKKQEVRAKRGDNNQTYSVVLCDLAHTILTQDDERRFKEISKSIFVKPVITLDEMVESLHQVIDEVNQKFFISITDNEIDYIKKVFELIDGDCVDQKEFCLVASLAERMTMMDEKIRTSFFKTDFKKLEHHIRHYRNLFGVYSQEGKMVRSDMTVILQATGLTEDLASELLEYLNLPESLTFVDFLLYIPFFMKLHQFIIDHLFAEKESNLNNFIELFQGNTQI